MTKILEGYGYKIVGEANDREQQFSCDLHGDGRDGKPSARYYPESNSVYCFACGRTRDVVTWVMEKEGLKFSDACLKLERWAHLPPLPWDEKEPEPEAQEFRVDTSTTYEQEASRVDRNLAILTKERGLPLVVLTRLWEVMDKINHTVKHESGSVETARNEMAALRHRIQTAYVHHKQVEES